MFCRTIFFCGEVVTTALFEKCVKTLPHVQYINLYSVSECHDVAYENLNDYFKDNKVKIQLAGLLYPPPEVMGDILFMVWSLLASVLSVVP